MNDVSERTIAAQKHLQETLKDYPEIQEAIKQSINDMRKPENMKPMVDGAVRLFQGLKTLQGGGNK